MSGEKIKLVKEALSKLINFMGNEDKLTIIKFSSYSELVLNSTIMDSDGKSKALDKLKEFDALGGTNIFSSIEMGFDQIKFLNYSSDDRFPTMILLSDGEDSNSVIDKFKNLIEKNKDIIKQIPFNFHTLGFGLDHDAALMYELSKIREGSYFPIYQLSNIKNVWIELFGAEVTMIEKYPHLIVKTFNYSIVNLYGQNEMNIIKSSKYEYQIEIIQLRAGKSYDFVFEIDIPKDTKNNTKILKATFLNHEKIYFYNNENNNYAYEQYIRSIIFQNLTDAYNLVEFYFNKIDEAKNLLNNVILWLEQYYDGKYDWEYEINDCINMFDKFNEDGIGEILSRIREGFSNNPGIHYNEENSYQNILIEKIYTIDVSQKSLIIIQPNHTEYIDCEDAIDDNFLYLYSDNNKGIIYNDKNIISEMNNEHDSIIYSINTSECNISIQSSYNNNFSLYYWYENNKKFLNNSEFNTRSLIEIERDFPLEFYSEIDGTKDINFNIDILELQKENIEDEEYISDYFKIEAYIIDENDLENIKKNENINSSVFKGFYDPGFRTGKILISKYKIKENLNLTYINFFYIKISNKEENKNKYTKIKALVSFTNLNNIYKIAPSNTYIRSNLIPGQKTPNLYLLKNKISNDKIRLEFSASSEEIDFALLNYTQYEIGDQRFYKNDSKIQINFKKGMGKYYFEFFTNDSSIDSIVLSIFSNNENNIAGNAVSNISYTFKYYISNDNNFNIINTVDQKLGEEVKHKTVNLTENKKGIYIKFPKIIYKENVLTDSKYFLKLYPVEDRSLSIYNSICLF